MLAPDANDILVARDRVHVPCLCDPRVWVAKIHCALDVPRGVECGVCTVRAGVNASDSAHVRQAHPGIETSHMRIVPWQAGNAVCSVCGRRRAPVGDRVKK